jgi:DNA helicase-2/ATP-dependent DNA helicase PcrA
LDEVALFTDIERYDADADAVVMMTMHAAKGLEFPVVFVVGVEEGLFPSSQSLHDMKAVEEERRLCYVAMTRAREELFLSCSYERMLFGQTAHNQMSRFLDEIPPQCLHNIQADPLQPAAQPIRRTRVNPAIAAAKAARESATSFSFEAERPPLTVGQLVVHKSFGNGMVLSVQPMGGDALLEIAFDTSGTKRMMFKSAGKYLTVK